MTNSFYNPSGAPATGAFAASAAMRTEFESIAAGFDKLPTLTANKAVVVNSAGTALTVSTGNLALTGNLSLGGNLTVSGAHATTLVTGADVTLTLPIVSGTLATLAGTETLSNKTLTSPVLVTPALGTPASGELTNCTDLPAAAVLAGALANGMTATTQNAADNSTKIATTAYADRLSGRLAATITGAFASGTNGIPGDDSIPRNTEGDQYMELTITPQSATSQLEIEVTWIGSIGIGSGQLIVALFQDSTVDALAAVSQHVAVADGLMNFSFSYVMTSGTTSATTFKVRAGNNSSVTTRFNGVSTGRLMGGAMASSIVITEVFA